MKTMSGFFDVYVLSHDRSRESVLGFLDRFLPRRSQSADDYVVPNNSDQPEFCFDNAVELLAHLETHPRESHAIYWLSTAPDDPRCAMVFPTSDGQMVYGLSVERNEPRFLADLMTFLNSAYGYIDFETPPPDTAAEFQDRVRKYNPPSR
jgi:hypothetical protein